MDLNIAALYIVWTCSVVIYLFCIKIVLSVWFVLISSLCTKIQCIQLITFLIISTNSKCNLLIGADFNTSLCMLLVRLCNVTFWLRLCTYLYHRTDFKLNRDSFCFPVTINSRTFAIISFLMFRKVWCSQQNALLQT